MLRGLPLFVTAGILLAATLIQADSTLSMLFGAAFIIGAVKLYQQNRIDFRRDLMSSSGIATILLFLAMVLGGLVFIFGPYMVPYASLTVDKTLIQYACAIVFLLGYLDVNFKRR